MTHRTFIGLWLPALWESKRTQVEIRTFSICKNLPYRGQPQGPPPRSGLTWTGPMCPVGARGLGLRAHDTLQGPQKCFHFNFFFNQKKNEYNTLYVITYPTWITFMLSFYQHSNKIKLKLKKNIFKEGNGPQRQKYAHQCQKAAP